MNRFSTDSVLKAQALFKIREKRRIKGKMVWVCIAICSGRANADMIIRALNNTRGKIR